VHLIEWMMVVLGRLPRPLRRMLGAISGRILCKVPNRSKRVTQSNINRAYADLPLEDRVDLIAKSLNDLGHKFFVLLATWQQPIERVRCWVATTEGFEVFRRASEDGPTLILLPHLGNWELFGIWLSERQSYTAMFRPMRVDAMSHLVRIARERGGNRLVPASPQGVKAILRDLNAGRTAIILPDQTPKQGMGDFVPFFGTETLTAILPYRIVQATKARVFIAGACAQAEHYHVFFEELSSPASDQREWLSDMNEAIERWVRKYPDQYQWEYNRVYRSAGADSG
jgi:Kdo2-lipid IVA lauroyltransferase/acyltransferase